jgi:hypothetical protein
MIMARLVTGVYYETRDAERAVAALKAKGIAADEIFLETEVTAGPEAGWKGGEVSRLEQERCIAGLETGLLMGVTFGVLSGLGISFLGGVLHEWMTKVEPNTPVMMPMVLAQPWLAAIVGAAIGLAVGAIIGWVVDRTLTRMGAGPPLPAHEALVTVQAADEQVNQVRAALFSAGARHLHMAERAVS